MASYVYSAAGGKLSVSYQTGTGNTSTQYCGNIIYDDNNLSQVLIDGGYITFSGTTPQCAHRNRPHDSSAFAGAIGYVGGSLIGRNYGEGFGRDFFYNLAKPGYEAFQANRRMKRFVSDQNNYIYTHYQIVY